ncbi:hypothetical protein FB45DRAFT_1059117 [Roridomyces roridus]|uniref:Uncharacterized protein n=1 Tax=Roridomyces roridus TaxID=1738132 RepID=A0AAD7BR63_9AGAR|nr:hypothetical protein FB45DRAFT_1059117 [Roridomyces roridus]
MNPKRRGCLASKGELWSCWVTLGIRSSLRRLCGRALGQVAQSVSRALQDVDTMEKLDGGRFDRVFLIAMYDDFQMIALIPYFFTVPKFHATASEVATMAFLHAATTTTTRSRTDTGVTFARSTALTGNPGPRIPRLHLWLAPALPPSSRYAKTCDRATPADSVEAVGFVLFGLHEFEAAWLLGVQGGGHVKEELAAAAALLTATPVTASGLVWTDDTLTPELLIKDRDGVGDLDAVVILEDDESAAQRLHRPQVITQISLQCNIELRSCCHSNCSNSTMVRHWTWTWSFPMLTGNLKTGEDVLDRFRTKRGDGSTFGRCVWAMHTGVWRWDRKRRYCGCSTRRLPGQALAEGGRGGLVDLSLVLAAGTHALSFFLCASCPSILHVIPTYLPFSAIRVIRPTRALVRPDMIRSGYSWTYGPGIIPSPSLVYTPSRTRVGSRSPSGQLAMNRVGIPPGFT